MNRYKSFSLFCFLHRRLMMGEDSPQRFLRGVRPTYLLPLTRAFPFTHASPPPPPPFLLLFSFHETDSLIWLSVSEYMSLHTNRWRERDIAPIVLKIYVSLPTSSSPPARMFLRVRYLLRITWFLAYVNWWQ